MMFLTTFVIVSMSVLGVAGYATFAKVQQMNDVLALLKSQSTNLHIIIRGVSEEILVHDNPYSKTMVLEKAKSFEENLKKISDVANDAKMIALIKSQIVPEWKFVEGDLALFFKIHMPNPDNVDAMIMLGKLSADTDRLLKKIDQIQVDASRRTHNQIAVISMVMAVGVFLLIGMTALILISIFRSISRPLTEISVIAAKIADGNLSVEPEMQSNDEIGVLADAFRHMLVNLRRMISHTTVVSGEVSDASRIVKDSSLQVYNSVIVQTAAIQVVATAVEEVDRSI
ncbi:MAG: methyl-accepting chemotaxis protein, partial [Steroidobacteraceae bacterium]|nr:methyl-accepting chemotaxis protein [Deltaproteobacteria bacterium]